MIFFKFIGEKIDWIEVFEFNFGGIRIGEGFFE